MRVLGVAGSDRGPGPGELEVLEEHPRQLCGGAGGETRLGRWAGTSRAAGRVPRAERGFEPMTRWSKSEKCLQSLHKAEKELYLVLLSLQPINMRLNTHVPAVPLVARCKESILLKQETRDLIPEPWENPLSRQCNHSSIPDWSQWTEAPGGL